jgi:hypothetical protein
VKYINICELLKNTIRFDPSLTVWELWDLSITDVLQDLQVWDLSITDVLEDLQVAG